MTEEKAIELSKSGWWKNKTSREICLFQLNEERLCMPYSDFRDAVSKELGQQITDSALSSKHIAEAILINILKK